MFLDCINTMIEFILVLELYYLVSSSIPTLKDILTYCLFGVVLSVYFAIFDPQILFLNLLFFVLAQLLCLGNTPLKSRAVYSLISLSGILHLELMFCSILPVSLLQTNFGNSAVVFLLLFLLSLSLFFVRRQKINHIISKLVLRYKAIVIFLLLFNSFFGQFYLSRLSTLWTYLPGVITVFIFILLLVTLALHIHHVRSTDKLTLNLFQKNIENIEDCLSTIRIANHDYKHQIQHMRDQVNSADDLTVLKTTLNQYIDQLNEDRQLSNTLLSINDPFFRSILYGCYSQCLKKGIEFRFTTTNLLPSLPLKDHQIVDVLQNLVSNAVEYNDSLLDEEKYIEINLYQHEKIHKISISSPCYQSVLSVEQILSSNFSTKQEKGHGIGLTSVQKLLKQNNILFYVENLNKKLSFILSYTEEDNI